MPIFTLVPTTVAGAGMPHDADDVLDRLLAEPALLGPPLSLDADGRWSSTFQVEAATRAEAVRIGLAAFATAVGEPVEHALVWPGEAGDEPERPLVVRGGPRPAGRGRPG